MLVIEKNKLYEKIKKEREKIHIFENIVFYLSVINFFSILFFVPLLYQNIVYILFFSTFIIVLIYLTFKSIRTLYKSYKYIEYGKKELNKIYEPDIFTKISEELILLEENKNISSINKDFIDDILNHKKDKSSLKEKLSVLKKVSQSIENN